MDASEAVERLHIESAFACHLKPEASYKMLTQFTDSLRTYWDAKEMCSKKRYSEVANIKGSPTSLFKLYDVLEKAGIVGDTVGHSS